MTDMEKHRAIITTSLTLLIATMFSGCASDGDYPDHTHHEDHYDHVHETYVERHYYQERQTSPSNSSSSTRVNVNPNPVTSPIKDPTSGLLP